MRLGPVPGRWWTLFDIERRRLLPRDRVEQAVCEGDLPALVLDDGEVLIDVNLLDRWVFDERAAGEGWVDEWLAYRQTEDGRSLRPPPAPFGTTTKAKEEA